MLLSFFFFNDTATTEIYTLSLHDALPISHVGEGIRRKVHAFGEAPEQLAGLRSGDVHAGVGCRDRGDVDAPLRVGGDRKSTRLNSSHANISYAVFCLKKKTNKKKPTCKAN